MEFLKAPESHSKPLSVEIEGLSLVVLNCHNRSNADKVRHELERSGWTVEQLRCNGFRVSSTPDPSLEQLRELMVQIKNEFGLN